jgi:pimeloyl-ACP methyl ester carboxylesterase
MLGSMDSRLDGELERAQAALLDRFAPETRVRRVRWSQGETQVLELGAGPPLLYVHGGLGGAYEVVPIMGSLARHHRVLAVDRPGHGLADPCDYRGVGFLAHARTFLGGVLDALELPEVDIVANSLGGLSAAALALHAPDRVTRLALVGAPAGVRHRVPPQLLPVGLPLVGRRIGRYVFSHATRDASRKFWGQTLVEHPERVDDLVLDYDVANMRRNAESMARLGRSIASARRLGLRSEVVLGERWRELATPTLLVWGDRDVFAGPEYGEALAAMNPHIRLVRLAGVGHIPWIDDPDRTLAEVERFLVMPPAGPASGGASRTRARAG